MTKPPPRPKIPPRDSDNEKRRLDPAPRPATIARLLSTATYHGISKHKHYPLRFGLGHYTGKRRDETRCDEHANFQPAQMTTIRAMKERGIRAGLLGAIDAKGDPSMLWTIADNGWIFEARITNPGRADYHGFPVRPSEAIAEKVFRRFEPWAKTHGAPRDRIAAAACRTMYGFKR